MWMIPQLTGPLMSICMENQYTPAETFPPFQSKIPIMNSTVNLASNVIETSNLLSQLATAWVTCHTSPGCVTHCRPILGNLDYVTLVASPCMSLSLNTH